MTRFWVIYDWISRRQRGGQSELQAAKIQQDVSELDEYVFVVHKHIDKLSVVLLWTLLTCNADKKTEEVIAFVDIKLAGLHDLLRIILRDVRTVSLEKNKSVILCFFFTLMFFIHDQIRLSITCCIIFFWNWKTVRICKKHTIINDWNI